MKKILVFGHYGRDNVGNEMGLRAFMEYLNQSDPHTVITVLSHSKRKTENNHHINAIGRNQYKAIYHALKSADVVIRLGGSLFQEEDQGKSSRFDMFIFFLAQKFKKKTILYGNGFGSLLNSFDRRIAQDVLNQMDLLTVRDQNSKEKMKKIGVNKEITITSDVAFVIDCPIFEEYFLSEDHNGIKDKHSNNGKRIGIVPQAWGESTDYIETLARASDHLIGEGYEVIFIPMEIEKDQKIIQEIITRMDRVPKFIDSEYRWMKILREINGLDLLIGMRLHALIFATICGVPNMGIKGNDKVASFMKSIDGSLLDGKKLDVIHLLTTIEGLFQHKSEQLDKMEKKRLSLQKKAVKNFNLFKDILDNFQEY